MKRALISMEGCYAGDLPDFWADADGVLQPEKRSRRGRAFRADLKQLQRWFVILMVALLVVAFGARWGYERKVAELEQLKSSQRPAVCTQHGELPFADTALSESCIRTVYRY